MITINGFHSIKESKNSLLNGFEHDVSNGASLNCFLKIPLQVLLFSLLIFYKDYLKSHL